MTRLFRSPAAIACALAVIAARTGAPQASLGEQPGAQPRASTTSKSAPSASGAREGRAPEKQAEKDKDRQVLAAMKRADALARAGKLPEAEGELVRATSVRPEFAPLLDQLARLRIRMGRRDEALAALEQLIRRGAPFDDRVFILAAQTLGQGLPRIEAEKRLIAWAGDRQVSANLFAAIGILRLGAHELAGAEEPVRKALELEPANEAALKALFQIYGKTGRYDAAQPFLDRAVSAKPDSSWVRMLSGSSLMRQSRFAEAKAQFAHIVELEPKNAAARTNLGSALISLGSAEEGMANFRKAIELDGKSLEAPINLATALEDEHRYAEARDALLAARRRGVESTDLLNALAVAHHLAGELDAAISVAQESLARDGQQDSMKRLVRRMQDEKAALAAPAGGAAAGPP